MRKLILKMSITIDGFVAGPNGEGDWMQRSSDDGAKRWVEETLWNAGLHVMGSKTFAAMAGFWPTSPSPFAAPMNEIPKAVFTRQPGFDPNTVCEAEATSWAAADVMRGDLEGDIARLKQQEGKDILVHGGAGFAQSLAATGLIDEYRLVVHPVALGKGMSLFGALPAPLHLVLHEATTFWSGTMAAVYRPAA